MEERRNELIGRAKKSADKLFPLDRGAQYLYKNQLESNLKKIQSPKALDSAEDIIKKIELVAGMPSLGVRDIELIEKMREEGHDAYKECVECKRKGEEEALGLLSSNLWNILEEFLKYQKRKP